MTGLIYLRKIVSINVAKNYTVQNVGGFMLVFNSDVPNAKNSHDDSNFSTLIE